MLGPEERWIAERIKDFIEDERSLESVYGDIADVHEYYILEYIMLRNWHIIDIDDYSKMVNSDKISPQDAYVYIVVMGPSRKAGFCYPFLHRSNFLLNTYLSKLGFYFEDWVVSATGLKYMVGVEGRKGYITIEVTNLDTMANNTNLRTIVTDVLGAKLINKEEKLTGEEYDKIFDTFYFQKLFAGHNFREALDIIRGYYDEGNQSLAKEVARIAMDYDRIFQPYRVCYDTRTWKEVDCWSIKLG